MTDTEVTGLVTAEFKKYNDLEIEQLRIKLKEAGDVVSEARSQGDLKENSAYHKALEDQKQIWETLSTRMQYKGSTVATIQAKDYIDFGATFTVEVNGNQATYLMLDTIEGDYERNILSKSSLFGEILVGRKVGDLIDFPNDNLKSNIEIVRGRIDVNTRKKEPTQMKVISIEYKDLNGLYDDQIKQLTTD